ncbi:hypothetical protein [Clostridium rectalis]|uniref:hypothetical protein n=1 Tax=Clostridium rectalis TaxID=2040295 RepID=UPI000F63E098|nr:hypothetical protein [Clostridium rectalis]
MKLKKKTAMVTSFTMGILMFATTAMAEVTSKSPYDQAKDAIKFSAESFSSKLSSYTIDVSMVVKDNGKIIVSDGAVHKCDVTKKSYEHVNTKTKGDKKLKNYYYKDRSVRIDNNSNEDVYYITEFKKPDEQFFQNPFKEKGAEDIEKIADALVGNLKDCVVSTDKTDGSKELSGSVSEAQIPAIVNAVTSYMVKSNTHSINSNSRENNYIPLITKDVYVKEVNGKMQIDKNGLVQNLLGTGVFCGKDDSGKEHKLTFEVLFKLSNVNSTVVKKPNLSGEKVERHEENAVNILENPEKYIGKYRNDLVIIKDGKFVKIGDRILEITNSDGKKVSGTYKETFIKGYENYKDRYSHFKFNGKYDQSKFSANIKIEGLEEEGHMNFGYNKNIYFSIPRENRNRVDDDTFFRVFE